MKRNQSSTLSNIESGKGVTPELIREAEDLENDPKKMLALIDLLFMGVDSGKVLPS